MSDSSQHAHAYRPPDGLEVLHQHARMESEDRPPLLFIHGGYVAAWCWAEHYLPYFADRGYSCAAVSLRGHGGSGHDGTIHQLSLDDYLADIERAAAGFDRAPVLIGHSMGGLLVQRFIERHGAPGAVLMASVPEQGLLASSLHLFLRNPWFMHQVSVLEWFGPAAAQQLYGTTPARTSLFSRHLDADRADNYVRRAGVESALALMEMAVDDALWRPALGSVPALVLGADDDALISPLAVRQVARRFGVEPRMLLSVGHAMMLDEGWRDAAGLILEWLVRTFDDG
ncbi:MAG: alpha/beta hydrolase [Gammaproteobacteria bacterium]